MDVNSRTRTGRERVSFTPFRIGSSLVDVTGSKTVFVRYLPTVENRRMADRIVSKPRSIVFSRTRGEVRTRGTMLCCCVGSWALSVFAFFCGSPVVTGVVGVPAGRGRRLVRSSPPLFLRILIIIY